MKHIKVGLRRNILITYTTEFPSNEFFNKEELNVRLSNEVQRITAEVQGLRMRYSDKEQTQILYRGEE